MIDKTEQVPARVAVIGCGYWGKNLVRNFSDLGVLAAVCDDDPERVRQFVEQYKVGACTVDEVMRDSTIDAIAIATPAVTHSAIAGQALAAGKHVFVEKPLALDVDAAVELNELSIKQGQVLMVGHLLQYHPAFFTFCRTWLRGANWAVCAISILTGLTWAKSGARRTYYGASRPMTFP